jgi:hypothetical protein
MRAAIRAVSACLLAVAGAAALAQAPAARTPEQVWRAECASCHMAYPAGFLPERSWRRLMSGLDRHFGEDASLDAAAQKAITQYLVDNSAERSSHRRAERFLRSIPAGAAPLRITETGYFVRKHDEVPPADWKLPKVGSAANCNACHGGAEKGDFSERSVRIPR